ncbi:MAG: hypothetical protein ABIN69_08615 [Aestuariivirga sp.]
MKKLCTILIGLAFCLPLSVPGSTANAATSCQITALKKADQNFKSHKLVVGLLEGGVTVYAIRTVVEKSRKPPKGAVMSRGGGVLLRNSADKTQWDKFYRQARATCHG